MGTEALAHIHTHVYSLSHTRTHTEHQLRQYTNESTVHSDHSGKTVHTKARNRGLEGAGKIKDQFFSSLEI